MSKNLSANIINNINEEYFGGTEFMVRPSRRFYPAFSLAMRRSQSFASAPTDSGALFRLAFAPA